MRFANRPLLLIVILLLTLTGCTRNRATPEPTVVELQGVITGTLGGGSGEPLVTLNTPTPPDVVAAETPTAELTVTPSTIDYYVQEGDTLFLVAEKFGVDIETVRRLNYLLDDNIFVGQILKMPFQEGITAEGAPTATPAPFRYEVVAGDSLGLIADQFNVSAVAIMEANEMADPNSLYVGQQLLIPGYAAPAAPSTSTTTDTSTADPVVESDSGGQSVTHIVQPGDTLYGIAQAYGVQAAAIINENNIANGNQLRVGQKLVIPGISERDAAEARGRVHIIQSGESLTSIAVLYGVTAQEIIEFNNISNPDTIYVGQQLIIPGQ